MNIIIYIYWYIWMWIWKEREKEREKIAGEKKISSIWDCSLNLNEIMSRVIMVIISLLNDYIQKKSTRIRYKYKFIFFTCNIIHKGDNHIIFGKKNSDIMIVFCFPFNQIQWFQYLPWKKYEYIYHNEINKIKIHPCLDDDFHDHFIFMY